MLRAAPDFHGRALLVVRGDRRAVARFRRRWQSRSDGGPRRACRRYDMPFARFTRRNGILAEGVSGLAIEDVTFREIAGFAILVSRSHGRRHRSRARGR